MFTATRGQTADAIPVKHFLFILLISGGILSAAETKGRDPKTVEEAVAIQVFLDRANFGPGKLDGHLGEFTEKALARYRQSRAGELPSVGAEKEATEATKDLPEPKPGELLGTEPKKEKAKSEKSAAKDKKLNVADLDLKSIEPVYVEYTVTDTDVQSAGDLPTKIEDQAKVKWLPYASVAEAVAERFHTDADFLEELNPGMTKGLKAGDKVRVPNVQPFELSSVKELKPGAVVAGDVQEDDSRHAKKEGDEGKAETAKISIVVSKAEKMLEVQEGGRLIAAFPVTVGSDETASPLGDWKVRGIAKLPEFRYDKKMLKEGERSSDFRMLPPGPNNPVGIVWIALNKKGIGIHGSDSPDAIGRNVSHGCIRLANWDAAKLVGMVKAGVPVAIR